MKIFLTGATGFIGSYFLRDALNAGHEVIALHRLANPQPTLPLSSEPEWLQQDLLDICDKHLAECDVVVHLASAGVSPKTLAWEDLVKINVLGSAHLIETANAAGVGRIVVAGSSHEYGPYAFHQGANAMDTPLAPKSLYGATKAAAYQLLSTYAYISGIELFYGRIYNVYGDGQYEENFWPSLRRAALHGEDFPMSSGEQIVDFVNVESVAQKILTACSEPFSPGELVKLEDIASGNPQSLLSFARHEWKRLGATGRLVPGALC